ncbi:hypothetical protein GO986_16255 [Deinococcus sp. HMF7620]|uniref:Mobilization protein n=1 Tax=Deinococcus arboris TaxID=2682977 RepID=A0A7C9MAE3_9DEIO|nr:hypothetical protein [Deinococcus arboris]MVN88299.1 hypothetical protein [Deinococcus arboris]
MAKETRTPMTTDREKVVGVRLSDKEHEQIKAAADLAGLKVSQYLRMVGLKQSSKDLA